MGMWQIYRYAKQPQGKKLHRTNEGSNFLGNSFSNRGNVRAPIQFRIPNITNLATNASHNAKINEVGGEIPNIANVATATAVTNDENKSPSVSNLVKKLIITQTLMKLKRKFPIIIMINILLLQNLISLWEKFLIQD